MTDQAIDPLDRTAAEVAAFNAYKAMTPAGRRAARDRAALTRQQIAQTIGCSESVIRYWETKDGMAPSLRIGVPMAALLARRGAL